MPLYTTACPECCIVREVLCKAEERDSQVCKDCNIPVSRLIDMPAKMKEGWSGNWTHGLSGSGKYNVGLGQTVYSERHVDKILKERGLVRESEVGTDIHEKLTSKARDEKIKRDAFSKEYKANIKKFDGDTAKAIVETLPAKKILQGD